MINTLNPPTQAAMNNSFPSPFNQTLCYLQLVVKSLPKKKLDF